MEEEPRTNAEKLNILAWINIILCVIGAIAMFVIYTVADFNMIGIISGVVILLAGFTLFYFLETVIDIYNKLDNRF